MRPMTDNQRPAAKVANVFSKFGLHSNFRIRMLLQLLEYGRILTFKLPTNSASFLMFFFIVVL